MGVNNQLLAGSVCIGVVTLVVAMDAGKPAVIAGVVIPPDTPSDDDVDDVLRNVDKSRVGW